MNLIDRPLSLQPSVAKQLGRFAIAMAVTACASDLQQPADARNDGVDDGSLADGPTHEGPVDGPVMPPDASMASVNGCTYATAQNFTATTLTVTFPGYAYAPKCARIRAGQAATFSGSFASHPLRAGSVVGGVATPDANSPIVSKSSGSTVTYTFPSAGAFPYYCNYHHGAGMFGAIYVDP